jgi:hypothetical protein
MKKTQGFVLNRSFLDKGYRLSTLSSRFLIGLPAISPAKDSQRMTVNYSIPEINQLSIISKK